MELPPIARYIPQKSKKRVFPGGSSSCIEPDVVEIDSLPINRSSKSKSLKNKEVVRHEVIDVDIDDDSGDVMVIEKKVIANNKGKEPMGSAANLESVDGVQSLNKNSVPGGSNNITNVDDFSYGDDDYMDMLYIDSLMDDDEYTILQSHFDNIDIPPDVEAPIAWLPPSQSVPQMLGTFPPAKEAKHPSLSSEHVRKNSSSKSRSTLKTPIHGASQLYKLQLHKLDPSSPSDNTAQSKKIVAASASSKTQLGASDAASAKQRRRLQCQAHLNYEKRTVSDGSGNYGPCYTLGAMKQFPGIEPSAGRVCFPTSTNKQFGSNSLLSNPPATYPTPGRETYAPNWLNSLSNQSHPDFRDFPDFRKQSHPDFLDFPDFHKQPYPDFPDFRKKSHTDFPDFRKQSHPDFPDFPDFRSSFHGGYVFPEEAACQPYMHDYSTRQKRVTDLSNSSLPSGSSSGVEKLVNEDEILKKFQLFKKFDTVQDHSDHHYVRNGSSMKQPSKNWAKKIQEEWKILEKDLPDTIHVRVYESRMDLLRAVIVGAEGTPYHDGLFFFDVYFPPSYPNVPPHVYYHSGGLRLNPNLYNCGKVCLSLLNTWGGSEKEKWTPGLSTMLQVLVSIQGLILNAKPFFNEPGYANMGGTPNGEKQSLQYNESTFILSLKTMVYTMKKPPKHFEDYVVGHFFGRARDILVACKAYMAGAQVGCLVRDGVQDVDEGDKSCSQNFKSNLGTYMKTLVSAFKEFGVKGCDEFIPTPARMGNLHTQSRRVLSPGRNFVPPY